MTEAKAIILATKHVRDMNEIQFYRHHPYNNQEAREAVFFAFCDGLNAASGGKLSLKTQREILKGLKDFS